MIARRWGAAAAPSAAGEDVLAEKVRQISSQRSARSAAARLRPKRGPGEGLVELGLSGEDPGCESSLRLPQNVEVGMPRARAAQGWRARCLQEFG